MYTRDHILPHLFKTQKIGKLFNIRQLCEDIKAINYIIIYHYKIAILHHGMQSFNIIVYCTPVYCTLVYCTIADRSDRFATSISLREHASEHYADKYQISNINLMLFNEIDN